MNSLDEAEDLAAHLKRHASSAPACPSCGDRDWTFRAVLKNTGGSLAGAQVKFSVRPLVEVSCPCGYKAEAKVQ